MTSLLLTSVRDLAIIGTMSAQTSLNGKLMLVAFLIHSLFIRTLMWNVCLSSHIMKLTRIPSYIVKNVFGMKFKLLSVRE